MRQHASDIDQRIGGARHGHPIKRHLLPRKPLQIGRRNSRRPVAGFRRWQKRQIGLGMGERGKYRKPKGKPKAGKHVRPLHAAWRVALPC